ncbi:type I pullulanase [Roseburia sp. 831b]|uniref:type I pullulanase n=1 Tax=Roseburia sp. 831b TaxID=1261635 RepID=UPI000952E324|nr:type I pullulanase [Roseburia sp. 831b]WVK71890.1 type I pullulanase [Roseburia sp. 831b]
MKSRAKALLMALCLLLTSILPTFMEAVTVKADEALTLRLHYHREDGDYDGWDAWLWEEGKDGGAYDFEEEDGEMVATKELTPGTTSVGFIIRTKDWAKDVDEDQFIDISEMVSGAVDIYVESGVEGYTKEYGEDAVVGTKVKKARYDGEGSVEVTMTGEIEGDTDSAFSVKGLEGTVAIDSVEAEKDNTYQVKLAEPLEDAKSYTITFEGNEYKIIMPNIYSTDAFEEKYTYTGDDLGATWTKEKTTFRVWAPTADAVKVNLYESGTPDTDDLVEQITMEQDVNGTWVASKEGDLNGVYYTYLVTVNGAENEACDPYARTTGVNGKRAMVIDLSSTNPEGWDEDTDPHAGNNITDDVIYELHIRDLAMDENSGIKNAGKFLGLTETGTTTPNGTPTGIDHIKDLGITHIHLLPVYDYASVDETALDKPQFNWGYDPENYNVPEGSYSTDPYHGEVRVKEMKQMVKSLHDNDLSVIMDVVYNHVYNAGTFNFNLIVPDYFSRVDENGTYSNGSGCGNDTASERSMVRKYIVDSVCYWADEYHIDGFRFDLVGLLDTDTINEIVEEVHKDHPNVIFYGEGWELDTTTTKDCTLATQKNSEETPDFAYFSDTIRDLLKGHVFDTSTIGYVSGETGDEEEVEKCFMGASDWCKSPTQTINYISCHDNMTLIDRITRSTTGTSREDRVKMNNLAAAIYLTAEGTPLMQAGEEFLRTKKNASGGFEENSYASSDSVNSLKWATLEEEEYQNVYQYYKGLIAFRKDHPVLRLTDAKDVAAHVTPVEGLDANVTAFATTGGVNGETADNMYVIFNPNQEETKVTLPDGTWSVYINGEKAGTESLGEVSGEATVDPISALVLIKSGDGTVKVSSTGKKGFGKVLAGVGAAVAGGAVAGIVIAKKRKKK